jgi:Asp-tRNA(Asn)/Glu-tRNA(Gln) amidotransferase A subunit family amidase
MPASGVNVLSRTVRDSRNAAPSAQESSNLPAAQVQLKRAERALASFFASYDLRLTPVLGEPPDRIGSFGDSWSFDRIQEHLYRYVAYTPIATTTGLAGNVGAYSVDRQALARRPGTSTWAD